MPTFINENKKDMWYVTSYQLVGEKVCFSEPVTAEEAEELYHNGEFEDVIDIEYLALDRISGVE
jgi:hypothetical protein